MKPMLATSLFLTSVLCVACGPGDGAGDDATKPQNVNLPAIQRKNGECSKQEFIDAELAAYEAMLKAREEAAQKETNEITRLEQQYKAEIAKLNQDYVNALNACGNDTSCTSNAKTGNDDLVNKAQIYHDDGIYAAQGNEKTAVEEAQEIYDAAVEEAKTKFCRKAYRATGADGPVSYSGVICDLSKPFEVMGTHPMLVYPFKFVPSSPTAGTFSYSSSKGALSMSGSGTYTVEGSDSDKPTIVVQTNSVARGPGASSSGSGPAHIVLEPLDTNDCGTQ